MNATTITLNEMKTCLYAAHHVKWVEVTGTSAMHEYAYDYVINEDPQIVVRVFTSIGKETGMSRSKGRDAIRVCAINISERLGWIKTVKVLRVEGWRNNLTKAIHTVTKQAFWRMRNIKKPAAVKKFVIAPELEELRNHLWTKTDNGFCTEASDLEANKDRWPRNRCHCGGYYQAKDLISVIKSNDEDYETQGWKFRCPHCNAYLTVFND